LVKSLQGVATDGFGNWVVVNGSFNGADLLRVWTSADDGVSWVPATDHPVGVCNGVATDGLGTWVAVGRNINGTQGVAPDSWISKDNGATWTANSTNAAFANAVATDALGHWVATTTSSGDQRAWASADAGSTWTSGSPSFGANANSVAAGRQLPRPIPLY